jgi:hypothetical protein
MYGLGRVKRNVSGIKGGAKKALSMARAAVKIANAVSRRSKQGVTSQYLRTYAKGPARKKWTPFK